MERRRFTREFKVEAVKLVRERGVAVRQAARGAKKWISLVGRRAPVCLSVFDGDPKKRKVRFG
jgi:hypothetical protein